MEQLEKRIDQWLESIRDEYVQDVVGSVCIPSVAVKSEGPYPFGPDCARMLDYMGKTVAHYGFPFENHEYYCASSLIPGSEGKGEIGMFGHTDVVPAGEGWSCQPYDAHVDNGYIVGRGSNDNKGSTFACIYAMRFLQENGIKLKNDVRLLYGCNEESGMADAVYYGEHYGFPDFTVVPDSWWPVSCSEKGNYIFKVEQQIKSGNLIAFETLCADNTVPNKCTCVLADTDLNHVIDLIGSRADIEAHAEGQLVRLISYGIGSHAAFPEGSRSAVAILINFLLENDLLTGQAKSALTSVAESIADYDGKSLGIDFRDDFAGHTTHVLTQIKLTDDRLTLSYKICYPAAPSVDKEELLNRAKAYFSREPWITNSFRALGPHYIDMDHPVVDIFCRHASHVMGEEMKPFAQAGGTYTWVIPNSVAAGPAIHKQPQKLFTQPGHGGAHQPDECMEIEVLLKGIKIYILALLDIDKWLSDLKN